MSNNVFKAVKTVALGVGLGQFALSAFANITPEAEFVPGELIVKLKSGQSVDSLIQKRNDIVLKQTIKLSYGNLFLIESTNKSTNLKPLIANLENMAEVEFAEPNYIYRAIGVQEKFNFSAPNDPRFQDLWGLNNTGANEPGGTSRGVEGADVSAFKAWEVTKGSKAVKIAVIDTGIDYNHPDLTANIWINEAEANGQAGVDDDGNGFVDDIHGYDFANDDADPRDGHGHGTHCAGTIGAVHDNEVGVAGVMADVQLVAVKFLADSGSGTSANAVRAIDYATSLDVDLMSNSWGGGGASEAMKEAIERAAEKGIIFTAAAGNSATDNDVRPHYPSNYDVENVVSVAAHTAQDNLASFSCYGAKTVHIAAPGHKILSTVKNGGYDVYSGTSMATPHVSGALGLLVAHEGRLPHAEMRERLMATSEPIRSYRRKTISGGRLNAYNLVTNTRPNRGEPDPSKWETYTLSEIVETEHPYAHNSRMTKTITVEGAKFIRVKVAKYDLEKDYDILRVRDASRNEIEKVSGQGTGFTSEFVEGDSIIVEFSSDSSVNGWGFQISEVEIIRE